jgi:hypothetical protein
MARRWWTLAVACVGIFMLLLDSKHQTYME